MKHFIKLFILLFLVLNFSASFAQTTTPPTQTELDLQKARRAFDESRFYTAATMYRKIYDKIKDPDQKATTAYMIAESYRKANMTRQALSWFENILNAKYPDPQVLFIYGQVLKNFERYDEAGRQFYDFLFEVPDDPNGKREMLSCEISQKWKSNPTRFAVTPLNNLNSPVSDYSPFIVGNTMYYASSREGATGNLTFEWTGQKYADIFETNNAGGNWIKPVPVGTINTPYNEGVIWVDSTGSTMYYTQCNSFDGKGANCKIYVTYKVDNNWSAPVVLPFSSDSFSVGHPAMHPDGKRMFFASDMPGGFGEKDLYIIDYNPNTQNWGTPKNLGAHINSSDDDMFPYVADDGTIYFSSKGHIGMGGLDIFKIRDSSGTYTVPENLKYPLNSGGDDFGIIFLKGNETKAAGETIGYFSSNRFDGTADDDDIYSISVKPFIFLVKGRVFDKETKEILPQARVGISGPDGKEISSIKSSDKGEYSFELTPEQINRIAAGKELYFKSPAVTIYPTGIKQDSTFVLDIYLDPIPAAEVEITLSGIYYDLDKYDLRPESKKALDSLIIILNENPSITIEIASHTDSRAETGYNQELSQKRAQSVVNYLLERKIEKGRLTAVGYGESRLINDCVDGVECTEAQHQQNRRTSFRVLSTDYKGRR